MAKIRITKRRSSIGATERQKATLQALGLGKINSVAEHNENDQIKGMVRKVSHLISIEKIK
ncbi:MAG: 50S ribosomal protein L30 [Bacteroidales bacterium]|nr:50S ribosomal protein L30 [Bacteroidales bacterium]